MAVIPPMPLSGARLPRTLGLQGRVLLMIGMGLVIALLLTGLFLFNAVTLTERTLWQGHQKDAAIGATAQVTAFLADVRRSLDVIASEENNPEATLAAFVAHNPALLEIIIVNETGSHLFSASQATSILESENSYSQAAWFQAVQSTPTSFYIGPIEPSTAGTPYVIMAQAMRNGGVVATRVDMARLSDIVLGIHFGESGRAYLVQEDGSLLIHTHPDVVEPPIMLAGGATFERLKNATQQPANYLNFQAQPVIGTATLVPGTAWYIVTELPEAEAYHLSDIARNNAILINIFFWGGAMALTILLMRRTLFQPLQQLARGTRAVAAGDLTTRLPVTRADEIGQVTTSFNHMVAHLAERTGEREALLEQLSQKVTELKLANELAQASINLKSEFLATMSHELRTPMHAIEGFAGIMLNQMAGVNYNDKSKHYLQRIAANSKRLLHLINDFLDLSRVEAGRLELAHLPLDPRSLAHQWYSELCGLAEQKGLKFTFTVDPTLPKTLYGDEEAISKVVLNLLSNAIKFTEKGAVTLTFSRAEGNHLWMIIVKDTGIGIPPHAHDIIFQPFRQVDQSTKRKYGGTGLGLAIVHKYLYTMGGNITVESEVKQGSTFAVTLPLLEYPLPAKVETRQLIFSKS